PRGGRIPQSLSNGNSGSRHVDIEFQGRPDAGQQRHRLDRRFSGRQRDCHQWLGARGSCCRGRQRVLRPGLHTAGDADTVSDADGTDADSDGNAIIDSVVHADSDSDSDADTDADLDFESGVHIDADADLYLYPFGNSYLVIDPDADAD